MKHSESRVHVNKRSNRHKTGVPRKALCERKFFTASKKALLLSPLASKINKISPACSCPISWNDIHFISNYQIRHRKSSWSTRSQWS